MKIVCKEIRKRQKHFPWLKTFIKEFFGTYPNCNETLQCLVENINKEVKELKQDNKRRTKALFETVNDLYLHFWWKIHWEKNNQWKNYWNVSTPHSYHCCELLKYFGKLLNFLIYLGIILSQGTSGSLWINRVLKAINILPVADGIIYDALLQLRFFKKKQRNSYMEILRHILCSEFILDISEPAVYIKSLMLLRRLKNYTKDEVAKASLISTAIKIKPPSNLESWLSSLKVSVDVNKSIVDQLFKKNSKQAFQNLYHVLMEPENDESSLNKEGNMKSKKKSKDTKKKESNLVTMAVGSIDSPNERMTNNIKPFNEIAKTNDKNIKLKEVLDLPKLCHKIQNSKQMKKKRIAIDVKEKTNLLKTLNCTETKKPSKNIKTTLQKEKTLDSQSISSKHNKSAKKKKSKARSEASDTTVTNKKINTKSKESSKNIKFESKSKKTREKKKSKKNFDNVNVIPDNKSNLSNLETHSHENNSNSNDDDLLVDCKFLTKESNQMLEHVDKTKTTSNAGEATVTKKKIDLKSNGSYKSAKSKSKSKNSKKKKKSKEIDDSINVIPDNIKIDISNSVDHSKDNNSTNNDQSVLVNSDFFTEGILQKLQFVNDSTISKSNLIINETKMDSENDASKLKFIHAATENQVLQTNQENHIIHVNSCDDEISNENYLKKKLANLLANYENFSSSDEHETIKKCASSCPLEESINNILVPDTCQADFNSIVPFNLDSYVPSKDDTSRDTSVSNDESLMNNKYLYTSLTDTKKINMYKDNEFDNSSSNDYDEKNTVDSEVSRDTLFSTDGSQISDKYPYVSLIDIRKNKKLNRSEISDYSNSSLDHSILGNINDSEMSQDTFISNDGSQIFDKIPHVSLVDIKKSKNKSFCEKFNNSNFTLSLVNNNNGNDMSPDTFITYEKLCISDNDPNNINQADKITSHLEDSNDGSILGNMNNNEKGIISTQNPDNSSCHALSIIENLNDESQNTQNKNHDRKNDLKDSELFCDEIGVKDKNPQEKNSPCNKNSETKTPSVEQDMINKNLKIKITLPTKKRKQTKSKLNKQQKILFQDTFITKEEPRLSNKDPNGIKKADKMTDHHNDTNYDLILGNVNSNEKNDFSDQNPNNSSCHNLKTTKDRNDRPDKIQSKNHYGENVTKNPELLCNETHGEDILPASYLPSNNNHLKKRSLSMEQDMVNANFKTKITSSTKRKRVLTRSVVKKKQKRHIPDTNEEKQISDKDTNDMKQTDQYNDTNYDPILGNINDNKSESHLKENEIKNSEIPCAQDKGFQENHSPCSKHSKSKTPSKGQDMINTNIKKIILPTKRKQTKSNFKKQPKVKCSSDLNEDPVLSNDRNGCRNSEKDINDNAYLNDLSTLLGNHGDVETQGSETISEDIALNHSVTQYKSQIQEQNTLHKKSIISPHKLNEKQSASHNFHGNTDKHPCITLSCKNNKNDASTCSIETVFDEFIESEFSKEQPPKLSDDVIDKAHTESVHSVNRNLFNTFQDKANPVSSHCFEYKSNENIPYQNNNQFSVSSSSTLENEVAYSLLKLSEKENPQRIPMMTNPNDRNENNNLMNANFSSINSNFVVDCNIVNDFDSHNSSHVSSSVSGDTTTIKLVLNLINAKPENSSNISFQIPISSANNFFPAANSQGQHSSIASNQLINNSNCSLPVHRNYSYFSEPPFYVKRNVSELETPPDSESHLRIPRPPKVKNMTSFSNGEDLALSKSNDRFSTPNHLYCQRQQNAFLHSSVNKNAWEINQFDLNSSFSNIPSLEVQHCDDIIDTLNVQQKENNYSVKDNQKKELNSRTVAHSAASASESSAFHDPKKKVLYRNSRPDIYSDESGDELSVSSLSLPSGEETDHSLLRDSTISPITPPQGKNDKASKIETRKLFREEKWALDSPTIKPSIDKKSTIVQKPKYQVKKKRKRIVKSSKKATNKHAYNLRSRTLLTPPVKLEPYIT